MLMKRIKRNAFTIFEVLLSTIVIGFIAMLLTSSLVSSKSKETLNAALKKNTTYLQQTYQAIPMLQMQGKLPPGAVDADTFMKAIVLTSKCIDLRPNGILVPQANRKFSQYIYSNSNDIKNITNVDYGAISYGRKSNKEVGEEEEVPEEEVFNWQGTTIILKNNVIISKKDNSTIVVDVNGRKAPNVVGQDIYTFTVNDNNLVLND